MCQSPSRHAFPVSVVRSKRLNGPRRTVRHMMPAPATSCVSRGRTVAQTWVDLHHNGDNSVQEEVISVRNNNNEKTVQQSDIYKRPVPAFPVTLPQSPISKKPSFLRSTSVESTASSSCSIESSSSSSESILHRTKASAIGRKEEMSSFAKVLVHAVKCRSCESPACRKMRLVLNHFRSCKIPRSAEASGCQICGQLLGIVAANRELRSAIKL